MKRGRLPLTALRSFEAAGRLLSFSKAADELFVSQAAISRQVRELEALIAKPLFERLHRRVELTEAGRLLLRQLTQSLDAIDLALTQLVSEPAQAVLKISVEPTFAGSWLVPRLNRFRERHPEIDLDVDATTALVEFRSHEAELAIRYAATARSWPRVEARHLFDCRVTPVLAPALLKSAPPLATPKDLARHTLLHEYDRRPWANWFAAAGLAEIVPPKGPIYPPGGQAVQGAKLGHGVALGDLSMEDEDLRLGTLVRPFGIEVPDGAYWLVAPDFRRLSWPAAAFAEWIAGELAAVRLAEGRDAEQPAVQP
jgi:LysR family glycine cleavage system transcriptional activator